MQQKDRQRWRGVTGGFHLHFIASILQSWSRGAHSRFSGLPCGISSSLGSLFCGIGGYPLFQRIQLCEEKRKEEKFNAKSRSQYKEKQFWKERRGTFTKKGLPVWVY